MRTLKILGFLLSYPTELHKQILGECRSFLRSEKWLSESSLKSLDNLLSEIEHGDLLDLQENYVDLFDRTPSLSLHLFEHVHGESRVRGQALADLLKIYEEAGLFINIEEMPDYLPLFAEYLSTLAPKEASETMASVVDIFSFLAERLKNRNSSYSAVFEALIETAARSPDLSLVTENLKKASGEPLTAQQIDEEWKEQFAFENTVQTTGQTNSCPKADETLARMNDYGKEERSNL